MSASIDTENETTTIACRGALRMRWSRVVAHADEVRAELSARGLGEVAARRAAVEATRPELRSLLTELLTHAPLALLRARSRGLLGWQDHVEIFLASDSVLLHLIDGASPRPIAARSEPLDVDAACDDARWSTWCAAWIDELRTSDAELAAALTGATHQPGPPNAKPTAETHVRVQDKSGVNTLVQQGLDLLSWLSEGVAGAHDARRQRLAREAERQRPLLLDDVLATSGSTIPNLNQMVSILMKDPAEGRRGASPTASTRGFVDATARPQAQAASSRPRPRARDFMPDVFFARMAAERAASERIAAEAAAAERATAETEERRADQPTARPPGSPPVDPTTPASPSAAPTSRVESPDDEAIDARIDALRLHVFTRQGNFEDRMSRAEQKIALSAALHDKAQLALRSIREELLRRSDLAAPSTPTPDIPSTSTEAPPSAAAAPIEPAPVTTASHDADAHAPTPEPTDVPSREASPPDAHLTDRLDDDLDADDLDDDASANDNADGDGMSDDDADIDDCDDGADIDATTVDATAAEGDFEAILRDLAAPSASISAPSTTGPHHPNAIRAAKLSALAAHFDLLADANEARLDALELAADIQLQNATALLAALEDLHVEP